MSKRLVPIKNSSYAKDSQYAYFWNCTSGPRPRPSPCWVKIPDSDGPTLSVLNEYYAVDAGQAYFLGRAILKADPSSFVVVFPQHSSHCRHYDKFAKDKHCCYCFGFPLEGSDPETFRVLNDLFALDKNHAYCRFKTIVEADPESFHVHGTNDFGSDGKQVFAFAFGISDQEYACLQADESTFKKVDPPVEIGECSPYYQDKDYFYCLTPKGVTKLPIREKTSL
jgi:hypothetical protein